MTRTELFSSLLLFLFLPLGHAGAQTATRTVDEYFAAVKEVTLRHSHGPVTILPATDGRVRSVTRIRATAKRQEDAEELTQRIAVNFEPSGRALSISVSFDGMSSMTQNGRKTTIKFQDGTRLTDITDFSLATTMYLPATDLLTLKTRFEDVRIDEKTSIKNLTLDLHSAQLRAGNLRGNLDAKLRFGSLHLGDVAGNVTGDLHDATVEFGTAGAVDLKSRFSKITCADVRTLKFDGHDGRLRVANVNGRVEIDDRFGHYVIGRTADGYINSHNGVFTIASGGKYVVQSRFTRFTVTELERLELESNHNSNYTVDRLGRVVGEARFTNLAVGDLRYGAELELYNGGLSVKKLSRDFTGIDLAGSFYGAELHVADATDYWVTADLAFGRVSAPADLTVLENEKDHADLKYRARTRGASDRSPQIVVRGREVKLAVD